MSSRSGQKPGQYAICHFVNQDVIADAEPWDSMYGYGKFPNYRTDENGSIIPEYSKHTNAIKGNTNPRKMPLPTLAMSSDKDFSPFIDIRDSQHPIPHNPK